MLGVARGCPASLLALRKNFCMSCFPGLSMVNVSKISQLTCFYKLFQRAFSQYDIPLNHNNESSQSKFTFRMQGNLTQPKIDVLLTRIEEPSQFIYNITSHHTTVFPLSVFVESSRLSDFPCKEYCEFDSRLSRSKLNIDQTKFRFVQGKHQLECKNKRNRIAMRKRRKRMGERISLRYR
ncbi:hypothetical protein IE077_003752 [Cardiosporidium cionae]|uniref:Uncharacterized protein n=1 Tax=Cardiosporidium cionae TaxID=476202 RepID=A0ABQ7J7K8_9APIC|nr:hypothetical protein IE077_003752 [Cardiosporidium cionae]|eukprot:KAF8819967.1 hypothetical protein IE077_003752 [Cardiosporidium cionae]